MLALIFPGQGSQHLGMGRDLIDTHPELELYLIAAQDILNVNLKNIIFGENEYELTLSQNAQAAILTISYMEYLAEKKSRNLTPGLLAGHSLGEWTALVVGGVLDFETALSCVFVRGLYMNEACPPGTGTMSAIMGLERNTVEHVLADFRNVFLANDNGQQTVISGTFDEVKEAEKALEKAGARRIVPLQVSGPFHTPLIASAQARLQEHIQNIPFRAPSVPIVQNVTAQAETDPEVIKQNMIRQITWPVRWQETILNMQEKGVETFQELGPKKVLTPLTKKILKKKKALAL